MPNTKQIEQQSQEDTFDTVTRSSLNYTRSQSIKPDILKYNHH